MWKKFKDLILSDLKIISLNYRILIPLCLLLLVIIVIPFCLRVVTHHEYLYQGLHPAKYYTLASITIVSLIPVFTGFACGHVFSSEVTGGVPDGSGNIPATSEHVFLRILSSLFSSFLLIIIGILIVKPVPAQGWLRMIFASLLFSFQAPAAMLIYLKSSVISDKRSIYMILYLITLILLPGGLMLHHPFNYPAFISPFYWSAWAWMIQSPVQSIICGVIAAVFTFLLSFMAYPKTFPGNKSFH
jgi:hypothetical protein